MSDVNLDLIHMVRVDELKPRPNNRNKHPVEQIDRLIKIIQYQGFRRPVIVSLRSGYVVCGHGRLEAAARMGLETVPVIYQNYESDEQEYADHVADNSLQSWSELDLSGINLDLPDLGPDFDIDMLGIKNFTLDVFEKTEGETDEDEIPEEAETRAKRGDVWVLGSHRLMCGDSITITDVERLMAGEKAALWSSDPPYGINHVEVANEKGQAKGYDKIQNDELQDEALREFIYQSITTSLPFMESGFAFYMWHAMKMQAYFSQAAAAAGILFHRQIIWVKPQFVFGRGQYHWRHELCLMGWLKGSEPPFYGRRNQCTVWEIGRENDKIHPTQKPVEIFAKPIRNHLKPGQIVYEPFSGSGSNFIAAEKEGVRCFGMEIEPKYCDRIITRWEAFTGKQAVLENA